MSVRVFITGSCSPALGNWEQQLGNAAILIGLLEALHALRTDVDVYTKYQLSAEFCSRHGIRSVSVDPRMYRTWFKRRVVTLHNIAASWLWGVVRKTTGIDVRSLRAGPLLEALYSADVIVDVSGDTYGDNIGIRHFLNHSIEILIASAFGRPMLNLANSPGPFSGRLKRAIARRTLNRFALVATREPLSADGLRRIGVRSPLFTTACPAFLLRSAPEDRVDEILRAEGISRGPQPLIGLTLAGYNLYANPTWNTPAQSEDLEVYRPLMRFLVDDLEAHVVLIPHVYRMNPWTGQRIHGPDYATLRLLRDMTVRQAGDGRLTLLEGTYSPQEVKGLLGKLALHISGRLHAGVGALSQNVPTVLLSYGHKHTGFAMMLRQEKRVWQGSQGAEALVDIVKEAWQNREAIEGELAEAVPQVLSRARANAEIILDTAAAGHASEEEVRATVERWQARSWEAQDTSAVP